MPTAMAMHANKKLTIIIDPPSVDKQWTAVHTQNIQAPIPIADPAGVELPITKNTTYSIVVTTKPTIRSAKMSVRAPLSALLFLFIFNYNNVSPTLCQPPFDGTLLLLGKYHCLKLPAIPLKQSESFVLSL